MKLPKCNGRPMMFAQDWTAYLGGRVITRIRIIYPDGLVSYLDLDTNCYHLFEDGCTSRNSQKNALWAVSKYFYKYVYQPSPLDFLGYL